MTEYVRGIGRTITASFTRPADTNAYTAGDVVNNSTSAPLVITFPSAVKGNNEGVTIMGVTLIDEANQATKPDLQLWLFDTAPVAVNDNAAFAPSAAEMEALVGIVALPVGSFVVGNSAAGASGNCACDAQALFLAVNGKLTDQALYGVLVVRNAYTPVSAEKFVIRLKLVD
jgi:hypothetical protein